MSSWGADDDVDEFAGDVVRKTPMNPTGEDQAADDEPVAALYFPTLPDFVRELLAPTYRRKVDGKDATWCPEWWRHAEAIARLEAMWRSWEHLRRDPATGTSVWFLMHADPHMAVLLSLTGPFAGCRPDSGHREQVPKLPCTNPPEGVFT